MSITPISTEQFLAHPRSRELRRICLDLTEQVHTLLTTSHVNRVDGEQRAASIADLRQALEALGVAKDMQTALPLEAYHDPVTLAEYIAGQLLAITEHLASSYTQVAFILEQERAQQGRDPSRPDEPGVSPEPGMAFMTTLCMLEVVCMTLDPGQGPRPV